MHAIHANGSRIRVAPGVSLATAPDPEPLLAAAQALLAEVASLVPRRERAAL